MWTLLCRQRQELLHDIRLVQIVGEHVDGERFGLDDVVEEREKNIFTRAVRPSDSDSSSKVYFLPLGPSSPPAPTCHTTTSACFAGSKR